MAHPKTDKSQTAVNTIGEKFRKARESKGVSYEEVHRITKIHPRVLQALEEDRLDNMLGWAYLKAFVKSYADYLGLDANEIVSEYSLRHSAKVIAEPALERKPILQQNNRRFKHAAIATFAFALWLFIMVFSTVKFIQHFKYSRRAERAKKEIVVPEKAEPKKEKVGIKEEKAKLQEDTASKEEVVQETAKVQTKEIVSQLIPIQKRRTIMLTIAVEKDVWLKVAQDGELTFHGILSKNSKETWQADKEILLSEIGRPEVLRLNVNGKDIDLAGKRLGKSILITHKGIDLEPEP